LLPVAARSATVLERLQRLLANLLEMSPSPAHRALIELSERVEARLAACRRRRYSGSMKWSWLSSPRSICTQLILPVKPLDSPMALTPV
jgi:hypothetical protein